MIISTVLPDKPRIEGNSVTLPIVRTGTKAKSNKGTIHEIVQQAIDSSAETYTAGKAVRNHGEVVTGTIERSWQEGEFIIAHVTGLSDELVSAINSDAYRGVSQEAADAVYDEHGNVISLTGTGVSFIFDDHPEKPGCPLEMGCGIPVVSTIDDSFNFSLNTSNQKLDINTPGGVNITDENTIADFKSTISGRESEIETLKSTIEKLQKESIDKDETLKSTIDIAVKTAIEGYIQSTTERTARETVLNELKSCISAETLEGFKDAPVTVLQSTLSAIKESAGKQIGASEGTADNGKIMSTYSAGNDIYSKLGVNSEDLAKYGGV